MSENQIAEITRLVGLIARDVGTMRQEINERFDRLETVVNELKIETANTNTRNELGEVKRDCVSSGKSFTG